MKRSVMAAIGLAVAVLLVNPLGAEGSPLFRIGEDGETSWEEALNGIGPGQISAILPGGEFGPTELYVGPLEEVSDALIMTWGDDPATPVGGWEFVYGQDPDLTNTLITFSLFAPVGIQNVGLELIDAGGAVRGWSISTVGNTGIWTQLAIDPTQGLQGPFDVFNNSAAFSLANVLKIRLTEGASRP